MILGRVVGNLWATIQEPQFVGAKIMVVQPLDAHTMRAGGNTVIAVDRAQAGVGDVVLVVYEGSSSRLVLGNEKSPCEAVIVGIVDRMDLEEE